MIKNKAPVKKSGKKGKKGKAKKPKKGKKGAPTVNTPCVIHSQKVSGQSKSTDLCPTDVSCKHFCTVLNSSL